MNIRSIAVLGVLLAVAGCASTSKVMLGQARAPVDPASVQIYSTPPAGSVEIAQLERPARLVSAPRARPMRR